ncbi:hypothetical protein RUND412_004858 [Rhizina undulata]
MKFLSAFPISLFFGLSLAIPIQELEKKDSILTRNDLIDGVCKDVLVIFARGTTELGNVGLIVGPPFFTALDNLGLEVAVQGVDYPADFAGYFEGGSPEGASTMAALVTNASTTCPDSKIILSGYSQGAQVTHLAADQISTSLYSLIKGIVLFGDPDDGKAFPGTLNDTVKTFCHEGDLICDGLPIVLVQHTTYGEDAAAAATWVESIL